MTVSTTDAGNMVIHVGTAAEIAGAIGGTPPSNILGVAFDDTNQKIIVIVARG